MKINPVMEAAAEALSFAGIKETTKKTPLEVLERNGATIDRAANALTEILQMGEPSERLRAAQLILQSHGVLKDAEKALPAVNITITPATQKPVSTNLMQLLTPNEFSSAQQELNDTDGKIN